MHETPSHDESTQAAQVAEEDEAGWRMSRRALTLLLCVLAVLLLIVFLPPLINVSRFHRRIAGNIGEALGRPVHFDHVSLTLLPLPGFTLQGFVIDEDPAFGYEPVLRADDVQVTLRLSSLWRLHPEFSKIAFSAPSVNLVHSVTGRWNVESLLLQASHIEAAPTAQRFAGPARRFPYIEATDARINLKLEAVKQPVSLTEAQFALWLPEPHRWRLRLKAHPMRSDAGPADTGVVRAEGTLGGPGNGSTLRATQIDLTGDWRDAQLGGLSRLMTGRDPGLRGDLSLTFALKGTVDRNIVTTDIQVAKARRADFVPAHLLALEASCQATAAETFHAFTDIECRAPPATSPEPALLIGTGAVPDVARIETAQAKLTIPALPAETFFAWLSVASPRPPHAVPGLGSLSGTLTLEAPGASGPGMAFSGAIGDGYELAGELELAGAELVDPVPAGAGKPIGLGDLILRSSARAGQGSDLGFDLAPSPLTLGGRLPATLEGHVDAVGYSLRLAGEVVPARLQALGRALPQLGDGLQDCLNQMRGAEASSDSPAQSGKVEPDPWDDKPLQVELTATRAWGGPQVWTRAAPAPVPQARRKRRR